MKSKFKSEPIPTSKIEQKKFCLEHTVEFGKYTKHHYNKKLKEKFFKLQKEKGLQYSDSMSDLSDVGDDFKDSNGGKPE